MELQPPVAEQARLLLGLGISHRPLIGDAWVRPLANLENYLDELDAAPTPVPHSSLCLAALGPKMLELARRRTAGAHPYLVTPEHTAEARRILGPAALLAPEQTVVLETDPERARCDRPPGPRHLHRTAQLRAQLETAGATAPTTWPSSATKLVDALVVPGAMSTPSQPGWMPIVARPEQTTCAYKC